MTVQPRRSRWMPGALSLALLLFAGWLALNRPITASLADGTTFELDYLQVAPTNIVVRGTFLGQIAERWIPANGWKLAGYEVKRPQRLTLHNQGRSDLLVAAIKLRPGSPREKNLLLPSLDHPLRFQIFGDDGYGYVEDYAIFRTYADGVFAHVVTPRFPRDSAKLRFRLEERDTNAPSGWREFATLTAPNPAPLSSQDWPVDHAQRIALAGGIEMEVGELTISTQAPAPSDLWVNSATLAVRFWVRGQLDASWGLQNCTIRDALGNFDATTLNAYPSNDWVRHTIERPLSPQAPWRFDTQVARTAGFPETNLFRFTLNYGDSVSTNFGGVATAVSFTDLDMLKVELTGRPPDWRLSLVSVRLANGREFDLSINAFNQHRFSKALIYNATNKPAVTPVAPHVVEATIAIHPNYPVQFAIQPTLRSELPVDPAP